MAAERVARDERTVQRWVHDGRLAAYDDGSGRRLVRLDEVLRLEAEVRLRMQNRQRQRLTELLGD
jgi:excisionase family DNA binding protein